MLVQSKGRDIAIMRTMGARRGSLLKIFVTVGVTIGSLGMAAGVVLGVWWLLAAATSEDYFATANAVATSWFGDLVFTGSLWAVWYHYLAGLRHLYYDSGHGLDIPTAEKLGWACIIGSVVLTVITILLVQ